MKVGDKCLILKGARVPFVVRETEFEPRRLLGEAYMHGLMHGKPGNRYRLEDSHAQLVLLMIDYRMVYEV
jgi:hypothetical protein